MYYILYGFLYLISLLPFRILYILSDGVYLFLYYIIRYRRDIVKSNLAHAFPEKSDSERTIIEKKFYQNFVDTFIETIKLLSVSEKEIEKRFKANWDIINQFYTAGRTVHLHLGHNFNWELANIGLAKNTPYKLLAVYMPITSKPIDRLFRKLRSRFKSVLLPATDMRNAFLPHRNTQYLMALVADQNPGNPANAWWFNFLNRPAPFVKGPAKNAIAANAVIIHATIHKVKRGYYEAYISVEEENPRQSTEQIITEKFVRFMESNIRQYPDMWLWSHRRWRREWKEEYGPIL